MRGLGSKKIMFYKLDDPAKKSLSQRTQRRKVLVIMNIARVRIRDYIY